MHCILYDIRSNATLDLHVLGTVKSRGAGTRREGGGGKRGMREG